MNKKKFINKIIIALIFLAIYGIYKYHTAPIRIPSKRSERISNRRIKKIKKYLESNYNEEFEVYQGYYASDDWRFGFYPITYKGTHKEDDIYYHGYADVSMAGARVSYVVEHYQRLLSKEKINKLLVSKLKELFGPNVVSATEVNGIIGRNDFKLNGAVYIYGSVNSDDDREEYREKIWEFIQFLKEEEVYDLVDLGVIVVDERVLTTEFKENRELRYQLVRDRFTKECYTDEEIDERVTAIEGYWSRAYSFDDRCYTDEEEFREKRREIMSRIAEEVPQDKMAEPLVNINIYDNYKKEGGVKRSSYYNSILYMSIISSKQWDEYLGLKHYKRTDYDKLTDVEFRSERY